MERLIITGVSGYIGSKLVSRLNEMGDVHEIIGIDKAEPKACLSKLTFYRKDIRDPLEQILIDHNVDTVVHLAYVVSPIHSKSLMEDININGTKNVLSACASAGVNQILYTSSATAYGFYPDNDVPLTEDSPLRGNDGMHVQDGNIQKARSLRRVLLLLQRGPRFFPQGEEARDAIRVRSPDNGHTSPQERQE